MTEPTYFSVLSHIRRFFPWCQRWVPASAAMTSAGLRCPTRFWLSLALVLSACASAQVQPPNMRTRIDLAIERSVDCFALQPSMYSDQLWFLLRAQEHIDHARLGRVLERLRQRPRPDGMTALVNPNAAGAAPPVTGPVPWQELMSLMRQSIACRGNQTPSRELQAFVNEQHEGYVLTHQILAMQWARSVGCRVPQTWSARESALAHRVLAELATDSVFNDLFVERVVSVGKAGHATLLHRRWLEWILEAQSPDGCWRSPLGKMQIRFRGYTLESTTESVSPLHTSSLAVCALAQYAKLVGR